MTSPTSLSIVIVNWNAGSQLRDCISSIARASNAAIGAIEVIVVDNASTDSSLDQIDPTGVILRTIANDENRGFAAACNQGWSISTGDYILFLNPDTVLFADSLLVPVTFMRHQQNNSIGICGVQLITEDGTNAFTYARFPSLRGFLIQALGFDRLFRRDWRTSYTGSEASPGVLRIDQMCGAFFMVRRSVLEALHGFDERFFVYFEEVDFSLRASNRGWASVCLTTATCLHIGGGTSRQVLAARLFYSLRSRILYGFKHFSLAEACALLMVTITIEFITRIAYAAFRLSRQDIRHTLDGYFMLLASLPKLLSHIAR